MARLHHARNTPVRGTGARPAQQRLDPAEVEQRRAHWLAQPSGLPRARALKLVREQLKSIRNRVGEGT